MTTDTEPQPPYARALLYDGAMSEREMAFLYGVAASMPAGALVVEIGSWKGRSAVAICEGLRHVPGARFVAVDPWRRKHLETQELYDADDPDADFVYNRFLRNTEQYGFVRAMRTTSVQAAEEFAPQSVDWVFIDGDHSFPAVRADIHAWHPKVKPNGLISGHDHVWRSVRWAVASHFRRVALWENNIWYLRKTRPDLRSRPRALAAGTLRMVLRRMARRDV